MSAKRQELHDVVRWLVNEAGLAYRELAELVGVSVSTVYRVWPTEGYISDANMAKLYNLKKTLMAAMTEGRYNPSHLPPAKGRGNRQRRMSILREVLGE